MSRASMMPTRTLTLMEELEKLEQSITLTLQEIDHNFSRAHSIVTTTILPVIEQYAKHSNAVWQGSEFWKGFFEASANVKLSSYEEPVEGEDTLEEGTTQTSQEHEYGTPSVQAGDNDETTTMMEERPKSRYHVNNQDSSPAGSTETSHATPRRRERGTEEASFAEYPSPYETLKREMIPTRNNNNPQTTTKTNPTTPGYPKLHPSHSPDNFDSSPFIPTTTTRRVPLNNTGATTNGPANADPLLHRVLDKNYRVQATPLTTHKYAQLPRTAEAQQSRNPILDFSSPFSPPTAAPQLRAEIFGSPIARTPAPRTPGISVQKKSRIPTPRLITRGGDGNTANLFSPGQRSNRSEARRVEAAPEARYKGNVWDSDEEDTDDFHGGGGTMGISPPKTMQFHIPASRLLRTPAREASKRIVDDLLAEARADGNESNDDDVAGGEKGNTKWEDDEELDLDLSLGSDDEEEEDHRAGPSHGIGDEDSPSVVRVARRDADADAF